MYLEIVYNGPINIDSENGLAPNRVWIQHIQFIWTTFANDLKELALNLVRTLHNSPFHIANANWILYTLTNLS